MANYGLRFSRLRESLRHSASDVAAAAAAAASSVRFARNYGCEDAERDDVSDVDDAAKMKVTMRMTALMIMMVIKKKMILTMMMMMTATMMIWPEFIGLARGPL